MEMGPESFIRQLLALLEFHHGCHPDSGAAQRCAERRRHCIRDADAGRGRRQHRQDAGSGAPDRLVEYRASVVMIRLFGSHQEYDRVNSETAY